MIARKHLVLFFEYFSEEQLGKDPFLVPYYLGKNLGYNVTILFPDLPENKDLPSEINGVRLLRLPLSRGENFRIKYAAIYKYIWNNAKTIDVLMRFFDTGVNRELSLIYKFRNPQGKYYIKMDVNPDRIDDVNDSFLRRIKDKILYRISNKSVDVISCETQIAYEKLKSKMDYQYHKFTNLVFMPNGFDEELLSSYNIAEKNFAEKEKIMITVGRLGTYPKNTEMFLRALSKINLGDWRIYFIGPIDDAFQPKLESFFEDHPEKRENVIFTGPIYDKKELWQYYNKSKVFVFTSEWESYGLVLVEAKRFRNYILTTPVGAAHDIIEDGQYGDLLINNNDEDLAIKLQEIINGNTQIDVYDDFDPLPLSYENMVKIVAERLKTVNGN